jgi:hypothetical protein
MSFPVVWQLIHGNKSRLLRPAYKKPRRGKVALRVVQNPAHWASRQALVQISWRTSHNGRDTVGEVAGAELLRENLLALWHQTGRK